MTAASTTRTPTRGATHAARPPIPVWVAALLLVVCGALGAVQSRINGELSEELGDGYLAAAISFGSGAILLAFALLVWRPGRRGLSRVRLAVRSRTLSPWSLLGGLAGAFFVLSQSLTVIVVGVALFTVAVVAGQTISGLVMDRFGVGPGGRHPLTAARMAGALLALVAVSVAVADQMLAQLPVWMLAMPLIAGFGQGWQLAVNGRVRVVAGSALTATVINFASGTVVLVVAAAVHMMMAGLPQALPANPWLYVGGLLGCLFIGGSSVLVRITGVLVLSLAVVVGQLGMSVAIDLLNPLPGTGVQTSTLIGTGVALIAVTVASVRWHRRGKPERHRAEAG